MSESVKNLINAISVGSAINTEEAFNSAMAEKISVKLDAMRQDVAANMFATEEVVAEESEHDPEVHVYSHPENKHLGTMKLSDANKKHKTTVSARGVGKGSFGINDREGSSDDTPNQPKPGRKELRFQHSSHPVGTK